VQHALLNAVNEAYFAQARDVFDRDVLTGLDLGALVAFHYERGAAATIHLAEVDDPSRFGVVPTFDDGEVKAFIEKPPPGAAPTRWINAGTYVLEPSVLDRIPAGLTVSIERETFPGMLDERCRRQQLAADGQAACRQSGQYASQAGEAAGGQATEDLSLIHI